MAGTWLIGVSGGPDSMALLSMCLDSQTDIACAHVNYHHRPEADEEEMYVRSFCQEHHIPVHVLNTPFVYTGNFEAAARDRRYAFFCSLVKENNYAGIMVAHHEDDLIETYFMQEEKNIEPSYYGLKEEILYQGVRVVRPLLGYTKKQLEQYCDERKIRYYIDSTNADESYARNRIRHTMVEPMSRMERDMVLREIRMKNAIKQERTCRVKTMIRDAGVSLEEYRHLPEEDRIALLRMTAGNDHLSRAFLLETNHILMKQNDFMIRIGKRNLVQKDGHFFMADPYDPFEDTYASLDEMRNIMKKTYRITEGTPGVFACTVKEDDFPLTVRSFREGDRIRMRFGTKSVHRFFIDRHIPLYLRETWPVVVNSRGDIILVPGLGCNVNHYSVTPDFNVIQYPG